MRISTRTFLAAPLLAFGLAMPAHAERVQMRFDVEVSGMKAMKLAFDGDIGKTAYAGSASLSPRGFAKLFIKKSYALQARGRLNGARVSPRHFVMSIDKKGKTRSATVRWRGGKPTWKRTPPHAATEREAITKALRPGVLDPLSLLIGYARARDAGFCKGRVRVFDGHDVYDIVARRLGTRTVRTARYAGPVIVCRLTYVPGPGSMSEKKKRRWRADPPVYDAWLAKVKSAESGHLYVPVRVSGRYDGRPFTATPTRALIGGRPLQPAR